MSDPYESARAAFADRTMSLVELAGALGISPSTCYDHANRGELPVPVHTLGSGPRPRRYVIRADVERHLGVRAAPEPARLTVVPPVAAPLLDALTHVKHQIAYWQFQQTQLEAEIAASQAAAEVA